MAVEAHERHEQATEAAHGGNRKIALLVIVLAAALAICETAGKNAQHQSLQSNIEANDIWAFYQAKTIRGTVLRVAAEAFDAVEAQRRVEAQLPTEIADLRQKLMDAVSGALGKDAPPPPQPLPAATPEQPIPKQVAAWKATAARYESDPKTREGRVELGERAREAEAKRDHAIAAYHNFEFGSAALQLAIVMASASIITGVGLLAWGAGFLGLLGAGLAMLGWFAPTLLHL
jgi:type IV secretory pathway VirB10-like protein